MGEMLSRNFELERRMARRRHPQAVGAATPTCNTVNPFDTMQLGRCIQTCMEDDAARGGGGGGGGDGGSISTCTT
jgi:hypothetical protein